MVRYRLSARQPLLSSQIVRDLKHATEPCRDNRCIFFWRSHTNLGSKMEIADRADEGPRKRKTHVPLVMRRSLDCIQQHKDLVQWKRTDRICQEQLESVRRQ